MVCVCLNVQNEYAYSFCLLTQVYRRHSGWNCDLRPAHLWMNCSIRGEQELMAWRLFRSALDGRPSQPLS